MTTDLAGCEMPATATVSVVPPTSLAMETTRSKEFVSLAGSAKCPCREAVIQLSIPALVAPTLV